MYHSIGGEDLYSISVERFREQMKYIAAMGTVPLASLGDSPHCNSESVGTGLLRSLSPPTQGSFGACPHLANGDRPCLLTFDDGLLDNYTIAFPIIKEFSLKAYFFVTVSKIGTDGYMNWEQLKELKESGMIIGSHGMTHKVLVELDYKELNDEIQISKEIIEKKLGVSVDYFSIPYGHYNRRIIDKVIKAGYKAVFTSNPEDKDNFRFGRISVRGNWSFNHFKAVMNHGLSFHERTVILARDLSKHLFGIKRYRALRGKLLRTND